MNQSPLPLHESYQPPYTGACPAHLGNSESRKQLQLPSRRRFLHQVTASSAVLYSLSACAENFQGLQQWYHAYSEPGVLQAVKKFAKNYPYEKIKIGWIAGDYTRKASVALLSTTAPDVLEIEGGPPIDAIKQNQFLALNEIVDEHRDDFSFNLLPHVTHQKKIYGIPQAVDAVLLFYRKSLLEKAGIAPPTTLEELITAAKKLSCEEYKGLFLGNSGGTQLANVLIDAAGQKIIDAHQKIHITHPHVVQSFTQFRELITSHALLIGAPTDWFSPDAITTGLCAMQICGSWAITQLTHILKSDIGVLPWPKASDEYGNNVVPISAYYSTIPSLSQKHQQAKKYAKWLWIDRTDYQLEFTQNYGLHIPARKSLIAKAQRWYDTELSQRALEHITKFGKLILPQLLTPVANQALCDALSHVMREGKDALHELRHAEKIISHEIQRISG